MKIICLCGSTKFKAAFEDYNRIFTLQGNIVLAPGVFGHADNIPLSTEQKERLDVLHQQKIEMADTVFIVNPGGYIGESTAREMLLARFLGKEIICLHSIAKESKPI